mmetsp:Transcript_16306/g.48555  ORF Transcript_16306/g.48555 Transcript_16306/m.48555 type:complete len:201 (-) Transcript_16306:243-845(-)
MKVEVQDDELLAARARLENGVLDVRIQDVDLLASALPGQAEAVRVRLQGAQGLLGAAADVRPHIQVPQAREGPEELQGLGAGGGTGPSGRAFAALELLVLQLLLCLLDASTHNIQVLPLLGAEGHFLDKDAIRRVCREVVVGLAISRRAEIDAQQLEPVVHGLSGHTFDGANVERDQGAGHRDQQRLTVVVELQPHRAGV